MNYYKILMKTKMKPFVKWAGGKEREYKFFCKYIPKHINNYIEPFVGGGAVYFALLESDIDGKRYINDFSTELYKLYSFIKKQNAEFLNELDAINENILLMKNYANNTFEFFKTCYKELLESNNCNDIILEINKKLFYEGTHLIEHLDIYDDVFEEEIKKCINIKLKKAVKLKNNENEIKDENLYVLYETSLLMSLYNTIRFAYNNIKQNTPYKIAYFLYIREYCYSSMFRYNPDGNFNVPYGGMSYNTKNFSRVIEYIKSKDLIDYLKHTTIKNEDFEAFLNNINIQNDDFIFLDPPYDSEFSEYAQNEFNKNDHIRLADWLKNTNANIMVVIKNTEFIYKIYSERGFNICKFEKKYSVNFQNRNIREAEHLIITNYNFEDE
jgi:DNA adenine methylase